MPTVPSKTGISLDVSGSQGGSSGSGVISEAASNLGRVVTDSTLFINSQMKDAEASDAVSRATLQNLFDSEDKMRTLNIENPTGYMQDKFGKRIKNVDQTDRTITNEYRDWSDNIYKKTQEAMPSQYAQKLYQQKASGIFTGDMIKVRNSEWQSRYQHFKGGIYDSVKDVKSRLVDSPDISMAYATIKDRVALVSEQSGKIMGADEANAFNLHIGKEIPDGLFSGRVIDALTSSNMSRERKVYQALAELRGGEFTGPDGKILAVDQVSKNEKKMGNKTISEIMDPDMKADYERKFISMITTAKSLDSSGWISKSNRMVKQANSPEEVTNSQYSSFVLEGNHLLNSGSITPEKYYDNISDVSTAMEAYPVINSDEFRMASVSRKISIGDELVQKSFDRMMGSIPTDAKESLRQSGFDQREKIRDSVKTTIDKTELEIKNDYVEFMSADKTVKSTSLLLDFDNPVNLEKPDSMSAFRKRDDQLDNISVMRSGYKENTYLKKSEVESISKYLKDPKIPYQNHQRAFKALFASNPKTYTSKVEQLIRDGKISERYQLALLYDRKDTVGIADVFMEAISSDGKYPSAEATLASKGSSTLQVKADIAHEGSPYFSNLLRKGNSPLTTTEHNLMVDTIFTLTMKNISINPNGNVSDITKQSVKQVIGAKFRTTGDVSGSYFRSEPVLLPTHMNGEELTEKQLENIQSNLKNYKSNISSPELIPDAPSGLPEEKKSRWAEFLQEPGNTRFVYDDKKNVFYIKYRDTKTGLEYELRKNGSVIEIHGDKVTVFKENRSFFGGILDFINKLPVVRGEF
jgi:hypothetical protein